MTRPRSADDYEEIARRKREIAAERVTACDCLKSLNVHGAVITSHVSGCPAGAGNAERDGCRCPFILNVHGVEITLHHRDCPHIAREQVG